MVMAVWYFLLYMLLVGMAGGYIAWLVLGKKKAISKNRKPNWGLLLMMGVAGSFVGGAVVSLLAGEGLELRPSGMVASAAGAILVTAIYLRMQGDKK